MKKISILIPTYNEEGNVIPLAAEIKNLFRTKLPFYDYEIVFIDNYSKDSTRLKIQGLCAEDPKVKAIFNARNFGHIKSPFYGLTQTTGDCAVQICADFQEPVDLIAEFVHGWEEGFKIVIGIKNRSKERRGMYWLRSAYYRTIRKISDVEQIEQFSGFGLYDRAFIDVLRNLDDPMPYMRGIVAELGFERKEVFYQQQKRRAGKTKNNWYTLYDIGMIGITSYSKVVMRLATIMGFLLSGISFLTAVVYTVFKLLYWDRFPAGTAPILIGVFLIGSLQLFFIGFMGEYILNINTRVMKRPLVIEEKRINFEKDEKHG
jgi:glycosyltransferase involved in cell wall biosynthesis